MCVHMKACARVCACLSHRLGGEADGEGGARELGDEKERLFDLI